MRYHQEPLYLRPQALRPFADWMADVDRQLERRTGHRTMSNEAPEAYWEALYHCGEPAYSAADEFINDSGGGKAHA